MSHREEFNSGSSESSESSYTERENDLPRRGFSSEGVLSHFIGVTNYDSSYHSIPEGYILTHDKRAGRAYIMKKEEEYLAQADKRRERWLKKGFGVCTPMHKLAKAFGEGIYLYFDYLRFMTVANFILCLIMAINIVPHLLYDELKWTDDPRSDLYNFYIYSYTPKIFPYWFGSVVLALLVSFTFGPIFSVRLRNQFHKLFNHHDHEDNFLLEEELDIIRNKDGTPKNSSSKFINVIRCIISYIIFLILLIIVAIIVGILNMGQTITSNLEYLIAIAIFLMIANSLLWFLCEVLTKFESHYTWSSHRMHLTFKFYFFKVITLSVVFLSRWVVRNFQNQVFKYLPIFKVIADVDNTITTCTLSVDAEQILILIICELTATKATGIIGPWLYYKGWSCCHKASDISDRGRPDFDLAMEYLNILYRQYIILLGIPLFPWITIFGLFGGFIDYIVNKWYLLNIARTPPFLRGSMRSFLVFFMFLTSLLSFVMYPIGIGWVLSGYNYRSCTTGIFLPAGTNRTI